MPSDIDLLKAEIEFLRTELATRNEFTEGVREVLKCLLNIVELEETRRIHNTDLSSIDEVSK